MVIKFEYQSPEHYVTSKTSIKRPCEIMRFSFDDTRKTLPMSDVSLKYFCPPLFGAPGEKDNHNPIRLGDGFESFKKHDDTVDEHLDALLDTIEVEEKRTGKKLEADIITWRGMITKIMTAIYDKPYYEGFEMNAMCFQGAIYIKECHDHKQKKEADQDRHSKRHQHRVSTGPSQAEMQYWGYKFESISTLDKRRVEATREEIEARFHKQVNNIEQYCSIVQTAINDINMVLAGEVDAVLGERPEDPEETIPWVELKTTKVLETQADADKYRDKLVKYWAQSFLLGVPHVYVGFRSMEGELRSVEHYKTNRLPIHAKELARGQPTWNGNACINFAAEVLTFIKQHVSGSDAVWRISHSPRHRTISLSMDDAAHGLFIIKPSFRRHRHDMLL